MRCQPHMKAKFELLYFLIKKKIFQVIKFFIFKIHIDLILLTIIIQTGSGIQTQDEFLNPSYTHVSAGRKVQSPHYKRRARRSILTYSCSQRLTAAAISQAKNYKKKLVIFVAFSDAYFFPSTTKLHQKLPLKEWTFPLIQINLREN